MLSLAILPANDRVDEKQCAAPTIAPSSSAVPTSGPQKEDAKERAPRAVASADVLSSEAVCGLVIGEYDLFVHARERVSALSQMLRHAKVQYVPAGYPMHAPLLLDGKTIVSVMATVLSDGRKTSSTSPRTATVVTPSSDSKEPVEKLVKVGLDRLSPLTEEWYAWELAAAEQTLKHRRIRLMDSLKQWFKLQDLQVAALKTDSYVWITTRYKDEVHLQRLKILSIIAQFPRGLLTYRGEWGPQRIRWSKTPSELWSATPRLTSSLEDFAVLASPTGDKREIRILTAIHDLAPSPKILFLNGQHTPAVF